jgi:hypothetical protein
MFKRVAQEITQLLADEYERRPSATWRLAKARFAASLAEGLGCAQIADEGGGLSDGSRAAFLDARLSPEERYEVVSALLRDPGDRAEISSAAALLDLIDAEPSPLPSSLLAQAATTFVESDADQAAQRASRRRVLGLVASLAALILIMLLAPGLLSRAADETPAPYAEPTASAQPPAQSATSPSELGGQVIERTIGLPPEAIDRTRSISARGELSAAPCDIGQEGAGHDHGASEVDRGKDGTERSSGAAPEPPCGLQASATDSHSPKPQPRFDGASLRTTSLHQSNDFRLGMVVDGLYAIPDGLVEIAGRAVSLFSQLGKKTLDLVDPRCIGGPHQIHASKSREKVGSIPHKDPRTCANHAASRVANKDRVQ